MYDKIYVFGHQNPDTDTICSSIAYVELKKQLGCKNIEAYKLGNLNKETQFVLNYFNIEEPKLLKTLKTKLTDLDLRPPMVLNCNATLKEAIMLLKTNKEISMISIIDESNTIVGIISMNDITNFVLSTTNENYINEYEVIFKNLLNVLSVKNIVGRYLYEIIEGKIYIGSSLKMSDNLQDNDILITNNLKQAENILLSHKCGCIILTDGIDTSNLKSDSTCIVSIDNPIYEIIPAINQSISVKSIMNTNTIHSFLITDYVSNVISSVNLSRYRNFPVIDELGKVVGIISRNNIIENKTKKVILIDHNERSQSVEGLEEGEVLEIIDHHRIYGVQTDAPIYIRIEPVGCTSTIVYKMYNEHNVKIPKEIAGIMLSAILSDTLILTSPTCTLEDKRVAKELANIAEIKDIDAYGKEMLLASTCLDDLTPEEILKIDRKKFLFGTKTAYISQVNTLDLNSILKIKDSLFKAMETFLQKTEANLAVVMLTDIEANGSYILIRGDASNIARKAFGVETNENEIFLEGVVSRKKQVVPVLTVAAKG